MNTPPCYEGAANVVFNGVYLSMQLMQILFDMATIIFVLLTRNYICKRLVNKNAIFLINIILLAFCLHAVIFAATQVSSSLHLYKALFRIHHIIYDYFFVASNCDLLLPNFMCMFVKIGTQCYTIFLSLMFLVQCCERTVATYFVEKLECSNSAHIFWKLTSLLMFLVAISLATLVYYKDLEDPVNLASCWLHTSVSKTRVDAKYYGLMIADTLALVWMTFLYIRNKKMSRRLSVSLDRKYQVRENIKITQIILICGCIYSILIIIHAAANMIRRSVGLSTVVYRILGLFLYVAAVLSLNFNNFQCMTYANLAYVIALYLLLRRKESSKIYSLQQDVSQARGDHATSSYFSQYQW